MINMAHYGMVDGVLLDTGKKVKPLYYVDPTNGLEQKERFLKSQKNNPTFSYRDIEYDPDDVEKTLNSLDIPDDKVGPIYREKVHQVILENGIIRNLGDDDFVRRATSEMYGVPNDELVSYADTFLERIPREETEKPIPAEKVKEALETALYDNGMREWTVELSDKRLTAVYTPEKKITVCRDRKFAKGDPERLGVHEVGVHALRSANGYEQPLKIFATGLPGYLPTEEGLASFFEEQTGNSNPETMRDYAARVIAVDSVCRGLNFRQTFERLKSYELTDEQSWNLSVRAHRAGGYIKDHVYLEGYSKVKDFAENSGDARRLYVGKVGLDDMSLVAELLQDRVLIEPKRLPRFLK